MNVLVCCVHIHICSVQAAALHRCCESVCHTLYGSRSGGVKASCANDGEVYLVCGVVLFYSKYVGCSHIPNCSMQLQAVSLGCVVQTGR